MAYSPSSNNNLNWNPADPAGCYDVPVTGTSYVGGIGQGLDKLKGGLQGAAQGIGQQGLSNLKSQLDAIERQRVQAQMQGAKTQEAHWSSGSQLGGPNSQPGLGTDLPSAGLGTDLPSAGLGGSDPSGNWAGDSQYAPWNQPHPCPACGTCPTCGRGRHDYGYVPYYPPAIPYYWPQDTTWTCAQNGQAVCGNENKIY